MSVANRVLAALDRPFELSERPMRIGTTIGIALSSPDLPTATDMLRAADIAMYAAKDAGKGRFRVFEPSMQHATAERLRLSVDLRGAVERGEFVLHYQPTVSLPSGDGDRRGGPRALGASRSAGSCRRSSSSRSPSAPG